MDNNKNLFDMKIEDMSEEEIEEFRNSEEYQSYNVKNADELFSSTEKEGDINGKTVADILGLSNIEERKSFNCFEYIDVDYDNYNELAESSPVIQETLKEGTELLPTFKYLHQDIFMSLWKFEARVLPYEKIHKESYINKNILSKVINTPSYIALRKSCRNDLFNAGIGTEIISKQIVKMIEEEVSKIENYEEKKKALQQLMQQESQMDSLQEQMEMLQEMQAMGMTKMPGDCDGAPSIQQQIQQCNMNLQQVKNLAAAAQKQCGELVEEAKQAPATKDTNQQLATTMKDASFEVNETSKLMQAWGMTSNDGDRVPYAIKKNAVEEIRQSDYLKKFTDMIGQYKDCAMSCQKKKSKNASVDLKSVTNGSRIEDILPSEKMKLGNDITKNSFYKDYTEKNLLTYEKESIETKNKGPIIVCVDASGSMSGNQIDWGKALCVGILEIAQKQKRQFASIFYDTRVIDVTIIDKDEVDPQKIINIANQSAHGGTDFEPPLRKSMELINDSRFKNADIVFITDGSSGLTDDFIKKFNKTKEDKEFRCQGVLVDCGENCSTILDEFCDDITYMSKFTTSANSEYNQKIFGSL